MAITVSSIVTEYGNYYVKGQNNMSRLMRQLTQGSATLNIPGIRHIVTEETQYQAANVVGQSVVQAYQQGYTPKGGATFVPNTIDLARMKVDQTITPDTIEDNWLGFLAGDSQKLKEWPIVRYMLEEIIAKEVEKDRELSMVWGGVKASPVSGTAGAASGAMNGFKKILTLGAAKTAYPIHSVTGVGALTAADIHDQLEEFEDALPKMFKNIPMTFFVSPEMEEAFLRKKRALGFYQLTADTQIHSKIDFTAHTVVGVPSMAGTAFLFATMPGNILHLVKRNKDVRNFDVQADKRNVCILGHWWEGIGFVDNDLVYTTAETIAV